MSYCDSEQLKSLREKLFFIVEYSEYDSDNPMDPYFYSDDKIEILVYGPFNYDETPISVYIKRKVKRFFILSSIERETVFNSGHGTVAIFRKGKWLQYIDNLFDELKEKCINDEFNSFETKKQEKQVPPSFRKIKDDDIFGDI